MRQGNDLPEGTLVTTDFQEQGRGRLGRIWTASPGSSLLASLLLKPGMAAAQAPQLTHLMALACARTLNEAGLEAGIRWPNDLICNGKKIAGILAEACLNGNDMTFVVLSLGINLNQTPEELAAIDRPATSCAVETGHAWDVDTVLAILIEELETLYKTFLKAGFPALKKEWESLNSLRGTDITLDLGTRTIAGTVEGVDDTGALILATPEGVRTFSSGEVVRVSREFL